jgi:hypothetical protein
LARRGALLRRGCFPSRAFLILGYLHAGRLDEALKALDQVTANPGLQLLRAQVLAAKGDRMAAQQLVTEAETRLAADRFPRGPLAAARLAIGDKEGAFAWLEKGVEEQDPILPLTVKSNRTWDPIRSDPRFQKVLRRMNLE